jgi:YtcA family
MNATGNIRWASPAYALASLLLAGCSRAPSVDILGSFFPAWLVCFLSAIFLTIICQLVLLRLHMKLDLPLLAYPSITAFFTFALWLILFH